MSEAIGIIGLALQLYVSCIHGYRAFLVAKERNRDSSVLVTKLQIEEARLESWGVFWGFSEGTVHDDLAQDPARMGLILKTLEQMKKIVEDTHGLSNRYGLILEKEFDFMQLDDAAPESPPKVKQRQIAGPLAAMSWAIIDKQKFEGLVKDMKDFNDGLYNISLDAKERRSLAKAVVCALTAGAHSMLRSEEIREASDELGAGTGAEPYQSLQAVTSFHVQSTGPQGRLLRIARDSVKLSDPVSRMAATESEPSIGTYHGDPVLVEWRSISSNSDSGTRTALLASFLAVSPKPADFRVLDLVGYYEDTSSYRLCFVSRLPPSLATTTLPPINLYNLIARSGKTSIPSLGERFRLAQTLSMSLLHLHAAGWLHRRIRSQTVLFFRRGQNHVLELGQVELGEPYITGFGYAYPDGYWMQPSVASSSLRAKDEENRLYRHPASATGSYRRGYDVYSLGMLLLEIGLWTRLRTLRDGLRGSKNFLEEVKATHVPRLSYKCGSIYEGVVKRCLEAGMRGAAEDGGDMFWEWEEHKKREQAWFYWEVVKELEKCCA